jgi:hypothetical protein
LRVVFIYLIIYIEFIKNLKQTGFCNWILLN